MTLYKFQSYSGDDFLMLSKNDKIKTAEEFCKKYVSYEYEVYLTPGERKWTWQLSKNHGMNIKY